MELTRCEEAMLAKLKDENIISWYDAIGSEVQTLNRLASKGAATKLFRGDPHNKKNQYWVANEN